MIYTYAPDALVYDSATNSWSLKDGYDHTTDRVQLTISDDDAFLSGDRVWNEIGDDANQTGAVYDMDGNLIASGRIYDEQFYAVRTPSGDTIYLERIEIDGEFVGWLVTEPLEEGVSYTQTDTGDVYADLLFDTRLTYSEIAAVPCFTASTLIATGDGPVPAAWLRAGDRVVTRDRGLAPVLWTGKFEVTPDEAAGKPALWPVRIAPGALGPNTPEAPLIVSPCHRILLRSPQAELLFGTPEVLVAAKHLLRWPGVTSLPPTEPVAYHHVLFERHEIVLADGQWTESLFLGERTRQLLSSRHLAELAALPRVAEGHRRLARIELRAWEATLLNPADVGAVPDLGAGDAAKDTSRKFRVAG